MNLIIEMYTTPITNMDFGHLVLVVLLTAIVAFKLGQSYLN